MTFDADHTLGLILAGGKARRMGGGDKALLPLAGKPMLAHVVERLAPQVGALALNANGEAGRYSAFGLAVVADERQDFSGPLAGLLAGLEFSARWPAIADVVSLPVDTPFLPTDLVAKLFEARRSAGAEIAVACSGGREHHLAALWPVTIAARLRQALLDEDVRKVGAFASRFRLSRADWPVTGFDPFFNVNTREDLAKAEDWLRRWLESGV